MVIPITDKYRLAADSHSWAIQEAYKRKGRTSGRVETEWRSIHWYINVENAVNGLADLMLRTSEAESIAEALGAAKDVAATLGKALQPQFEVKAK